MLDRVSEDASVARINRARDIGRGGRAEEQRQVRELIFGAVAAEWDGLFGGRTSFRSGRQAAHAFRIVSRSGRDAVDANAFRSPLDRQRLHQQLDAGFGRADMRLIGDRHMRVIRRNADHGGAGLAQRRVRRAAGVERAEQVDIDHGLESVRRHARHRRGKIPGGAAQQDVDLAQFVARLVHRSLDRRVIANIERGGLREASRAADRRRGRVQFFLLPAHQHDFRAVFGETLRHALSDAAAASGHECDFVFK